MAGLQGRVFAAGPIPPADQHHAHVEHDGGDREEIDDSRQAEDPPPEHLALAAHAPLPHRRGHRMGQTRNDVDVGHQHQRRVEQGPQDIGHRQVPRQERGHHADREHRQPQQPVADVRADKKAPVGTAQEFQHHEVADRRDQQGDRVDRHGGQVLSQHDVEVGRRNGEQQFVGPLRVSSAQMLIVMAGTKISMMNGKNLLS